MTRRFRLMSVLLLTCALVMPMAASGAVFAPRAIDRYSGVAMWPPVGSQKYLANIGGMAPTLDGAHLWVSDQNNDRILKISTVDGSVVQAIGRRGDGNAEFTGPAGIAIRPSNGDILVCDYENSRVQVFSADGAFKRTFGTYGIGNGQLRTPVDVAFGANGDIYVAEEYGQRISKFTGTDYNYITKWTTTSFPKGIVEVGNELLVAEGNGSCVRRYPKAGGLPQGSFGANVAGNSQMVYPSDIATTAAGDLLVADESFSSVKKFTSAGVWIDHIALQAPGTSYWEMDSLQLPRCVTTYGNTIYVADSTGIKRYRATGPTPYAFDGAPWAAGRAEPGYFYHPQGIACGTVGTSRFVWVMDREMQRIQKFNVDASGNLASAPATSITQFPYATYAYDIDVDSSGYLYISDSYSNKVYKMTPSGAFDREWQVVPLVVNDGPRGLDVYGNKVYVTDAVNHTVRVFGTDGAPDATPTVGGNPGSTVVPAVTNILDVAVTGAGVFVLDGSQPFVKKYRHNGTESPLNDYLGSWGYGGFGPIPDAISSDWLGNIYVTQKVGDRIAKFNGNGVFLGDIGSPGTGIGELSAPIDVKIDSNLDAFVLEYGSRRVQTFRSNRTTRPVARLKAVPAYNTKASFSIDVLDADGLRAAAYYPLQIRWSNSPTSGWSGWWDTWGAGSDFATLTNLTGRRYFQVRSVAQPGYTGSTSAVFSVSPKVAIGTPGAPTTMYTTRTYAIKGSLRPRHTAGTYPVRLYKYKKISTTTWKNYGYVRAVASNYSTYSFYAGSVRLPYRGAWKIVAYAPADSQHAATWSAPDYVTVR